jgi:REP element-mobilizing transposase RayT
LPAQPVHVTLRSRLGPLRSQHLFPVVQLAIRRACHRDPRRFRVVHFSVQRDHVHLVVEARSARALSSGMRSVAIRVARYVNDLLSRRGPLWADRWHGRALTSPREVRNVLLYVLANFRKHARRDVAAGLDAYSSAAWFDGWREWAPSSGLPPPLAGPRRPAWLRLLTEAGDERGQTGSELEKCPVLASGTWLGGQGWRRYGLLGVTESPLAS